jgi:hypothetical protein
VDPPSLDESAPGPPEETAKGAMSAKKTKKAALHASGCARE